MSGKRQHVIPKFLQEGFAIRNAQAKQQTWVFRKDKPPFKSNILNVGVEGGFYTDGHDSEADDLITAAESNFSVLVRSLRAHTVSSLSDPMLPELIAHLEVRTRHLRETFLHTGNFIVAGFLDFMSKEDAFADWLIRRITDEPELIRQACEKELADRNLPQNFLEPMVHLSMRLGPSLINRQRNEFRRFARMLKPILAERLKEAVKSGHVKALKGSIAPDNKVKVLNDLSYKVLTLNRSSLILGDSIVLYCVDGDPSIQDFSGYHRHTESSLHAA